MVDDPIDLPRRPVRPESGGRDAGEPAAEGPAAGAPGEGSAPEVPGAAGAPGEERRRASEGWSDLEGGGEVWGLVEEGDEALFRDRDDMPFDDAAGGGGPALPPPTPARGGLRLFLQFAGFPILIVAVCTGIFLLFGLIATEKHTPLELLHEVRTGGKHKRWQAAYELAKHLVAEPEVARDPELGQAILETFREARGKDPEVRKYLAQTVGAIEHPGAVAALLEALEDDSGDVRLYAALSLGRRRDSAALPALLDHLRHDEDEGVRTAAASALTLLADPAAAPTLREALEDGSRDVRWNAALALAQVGDGSGRSILRELLDRKTLLRETEMDEELSVQSALHAIEALEKLGSLEDVPALRALSRDDGDPRVRERAADAIEALGG